MVCTSPPGIQVFSNEMVACDCFVHAVFVRRSRTNHLQLPYPWTWVHIHVHCIITQCMYESNTIIIVWVDSIWRDGMGGWPHPQATPALKRICFNFHCIYICYNICTASVWTLLSSSLWVRQGGSASGQLPERLHKACHCTWMFSNHGARISNRSYWSLLCSSIILLF